MSGAASTKFGGSSGFSVSNAGSRARGGIKGATQPVSSINIMGKFGATGTIVDHNEDLGN